MVKGNFSMYKDAHALKLLNDSAPHGPAKLVQIAEPAHASMAETNQ
jgi:hypothetical protein